MSDKLSNYSRADDPMKAAEVFFREAAAVCERNAQGGTESSGRMFLQHAAVTSGELADALRAQREGPDTEGQQTYVQYTPEQALPGRERLDALAKVGQDAEAALAELEGAAQQWVEIFEKLRETSSSAESEQELHAACSELMDGWRRKLATTFHRGSDL